jgi:hypothetical protein
LRVKHEEGGGSKACFVVAKEILRGINPTQVQIRSALPEVFLTKKQARYVVYALAERAQSKTKAVEMRSNSLEHIFPENADRRDWPNAEDTEPYIWHSGNLTVLEPSYNREAGRKNYQAKKVIYAKSDIVITRNIPTNYDSWDASSILERGAKFLPLINDVWPESI